MRLPESIRDDRDPGLHIDSVADAAARLDGVEVESLHDPAEHWAVDYRRVQHARQTDIDAELRGTVHLRLHVESFDRCPDELELRRWLDRHLADIRDRRRIA